jgi:putative membrane protein
MNHAANAKQSFEGTIMITKLRLSVTGISLAAAAFAALLPTPAAGQSSKGSGLDDPTIVAIFDAANSWDIETGAIASQRARSKEVRDFARMLQFDHKAVRQQGRDLARKLGVTPTPPANFGMAKDHAAAVKRLRSVKRSSFDREFLRHEVAFHKAVFDAVTTTLLPSLKNEEVKALVVKVAPAFQAHMAKAQSLLDNLK